MTSFRTIRELRRGSAVDAPLRGLSLLREVVRPSPKDAPLTATEIMESPAYQDLWTANVREGDLAPDFQLDKLSVADGIERPTADGRRTAAPT